MAQIRPLNAGGCTFRKIMKGIGFTVNQEDTSTYYLNLPAEIMAFISSNLDEGINGLVGISITVMANGFKFNQPGLISKFLEVNASNLTACSPFPAKCVLETLKGLSMDKEYFKKIGRLLLIAKGSWPDITYAINYLPCFSLGPTLAPWDVLLHLIDYLQFTSNEGIFILRQTETSIFCCVDTNRSTHGFILFHRDNPIAWQSKWQTMVAVSMAQSKYLALSFAAKECLWISHVFAPIMRTPISTLMSDNKTEIVIATDSISRKQTCHLIREFNVINEYIVIRKIALNWVSTQEKLADIMTIILGHIALRHITVSIIHCC
ncbi:hypothetical protein O181_016522 [Austropuccinia psidii MF-1]|uniref:Uncharacterized protein n=1 Tax=Austropuccinia psidii MF-1 TaxID=1389203 RepID=A0A9Q3C5U1_9BASI|nr:hypothetical protein [Austropuccinia psidii MF-1]